jgi:hypothetical protein
VDDLEVLIKRCNDTYVDGRGVLLPITDQDLVSMLEKVAEGRTRFYETFLAERFRVVAAR